MTAETTPWDQAVPPFFPYARFGCYVFSLFVMERGLVWLLLLAGLVPGTKRGIGAYWDTPGSPSKDLQLNWARNLTGENGYVVLFVEPVPLDQPASPEQVSTWKNTVQAALDHSLIPVVRMGWHGHSMRDFADVGSNRTRYDGVAKRFAAIAAELQTIITGQPMYVHVGNELDACNEWTCTDPETTVLDVPTRVKEVAGFMDSVFTALSALPNSQDALRLAHAPISNWHTDGCQCTTNKPVGTGRPGTLFLSALLTANKNLYRTVDWLSSHSYPFGNANFTDPHATRGLTWYRNETRVLGRPGLPVIITETGWALEGGQTHVTEAEQAEWLAAAAKQFWANDTELLGVCPFLLAGAFWQARNGREFIDCSPVSPVGQCLAPFRQKPVFSAWQSVQL